jgi:catalase
VIKIVAPRLGTVAGTAGTELKIDFSFLTCSSVLFDAVYVPGGEQSITALYKEPAAIHFLNEAYKHCKAIAATSEGVDLLYAAFLKLDSLPGKRESKNVVAEEGIIHSRAAQVGKVATEFIKAIAQHRAWSREKKDQPPA